MLKHYHFFLPSELKPKGWLLDQLKLQRNGLNGHLDKMWPDVRDSRWIGGDREGWERVPYWLDGFIPLAFLLDDADMQARAKRYIDKILSFQQADGWICPNGEKPREKYDTWAVILIAKVLTVWGDCAQDERIPGVVYRILKNYYDLLSSGAIKLFEWGKYRWFEGYISIKWLCEQVGEEPWMRKLAELLAAQGMDYETVADLWERPINRWRQDTHVVNIAMMLKSEAVVCDLLDREYTDQAERFWSLLERCNGTAVGTLTGDECLSGVSPIQGTELCSVVELMYSFERIYALTGDPKWAERLEQVAFNALPATLSDDMWTHQYDQLTNQISCVPFDGNPIFRTNGRDSHLFGLEPHFGCCTANFGQGYPKLALSAFLYNEYEIVSACPLPSVLETDWRGVPIRIELETQYPFRNRFVYRVHAAESTDLTLRVRVPSFAKALQVNGQPRRRCAYLEFSGFAAGETVITVEFETVPALSARPNGMYVCRCGSLVFAAPIASRAERVEYESNGVERKYPYCDYRIAPIGGWNLAFGSKRLTVVPHEVSAVPFSSTEPPVTVRAELCHIDWGYADGYDNVCAKQPTSRRALDGATTVELYPYGCAKLRMTEMPIAR